jgi:putative ABC transport system permease protein
MVNNYLTIAFRMFWKNKWQTLINVSGLGVGIACCVLIILYVHSELTYDSFHSRANRIYRAWFKVDNGNGQVSTHRTTPFPMGPALKANLEEVESVVRVSPIFPWIKIDGEQFTERVNFVERNFFQVFDFPLADGDSIDFILEPKDAIITSSKAAKYFGKADAINKNISIQIGQNFENFTIRAVVADAPALLTKRLYANMDWKIPSGK